MRPWCAALGTFFFACPAFVSAGAEPAANPQPGTEIKLDVRKFQVVERDSGPVSYYRVIEEDGTTMIRAQYRPPLETVTMGMEVPDAVRSKVKFLRWRWRVLTFPKDADECSGGRSDSAAAVFVTFKRGLKYYILKYAWTTMSRKGAVCNKRRNPFMNRDTTVMEVDGPINTWLSEQIDPKAEFVRHFGGTLGDVPDFVGIGLMTDGDQTKSLSEADYADFSVTT